MGSPENSRLFTVYDEAAPQPDLAKYPLPPRGYITDTPQAFEREAPRGVLLRLKQSVRLIDDLDLDALSAQYGGLDSAEHDGVQTLIALARELRTTEKTLRSRKAPR